MTFGSAATLDLHERRVDGRRLDRCPRPESPNVVATDGAITTTGGNRLAVTVSPAATSTFAVTDTAGAPQTAGGSFDLTVRARDSYGNTTPGYAGTVAFTSTDGAAVLPASYTFVPGTDTGVHTFSNGATLKTAGSRTITATDSITPAIAATTAAVTVNAAGATHLVVSSSAAPTQIAGSPFDLTVVAKDQFNNVDPSYGGTVALTSSDPSAVLPASYHFLPADLGTHTFSGGVTLKTAGSRSVTATDTVTGSINGSTSVNVGAGAATHLTVTTTAGAPRRPAHRSLPRSSPGTRSRTSTRPTSARCTSRPPTAWPCCPPTTPSPPPTAAHAPSRRASR